MHRWGTDRYYYFGWLVGWLDFMAYQLFVGYLMLNPFLY